MEQLLELERASRAFRKAIQSVTGARPVSQSKPFDFVANYEQNAQRMLTLLESCAETIAVP